MQAATRGCRPLAKSLQLIDRNAAGDGTAGQLSPGAGSLSAAASPHRSADATDIVDSAAPDGNASPFLPEGNGSGASGPEHAGEADRQTGGDWDSDSDDGSYQSAEDWPASPEQCRHQPAVAASSGLLSAARAIDASSAQAAIASEAPENDGMDGEHRIAMAEPTDDGMASADGKADVIRTPQVACSATRALYGPTRPCPQTLRCT